MGAKLLYRDAQGRDAAVDLPEVGAFLGRAVECIVRTDDALVSRRNCKISALGGRWYVEDLGSANGTYINERRIQRDALNHGDVIRCGSLQVRFVEVADAAPQRVTVPPAQQIQANVSGGIQAAQSSDDTRALGGANAMAAMMAADKDKPGAAAAENKDKADKEKKAGDSGVNKTREELTKLQEDFKKAQADLDAAAATVKEATEARDQAVSKVEGMEAELKRLRNETSSNKDALEKLTRQAKKDKELLDAETKVNEELRQDLKQLREQLNKAQAQIDELRTASEAKDRQIASASEDVRRAKKEVEGLNAQLIKLSRDRDEQIRSMNNQRGDVDHLRDILKERDRIIEEQRVGLINQESQIKDLRKKADDLEQNFAQARGERDNLRERLNRSQVQVEELRSELDRVHQVLAGQTSGGEQLLSLSQENRTLRNDIGNANAEIASQHEKLQKLQAELVELSKVREKLQVEQKSAAGKLQQAVEQAVQGVTTELKKAHEEELKKLAEQQDAVIKDRDELRARAAEFQRAVEKQQFELTEARGERDQLRAKVAELEAQPPPPPPKAAAPTTTTQSLPAAGGASGAAEQQLAELRTVASDAYDGINDALSELRLSIVMAQETYAKMERTLADKDAARKLRDAIEQTMDRADEAKGHIRSLRSLIE